MKPSKGSVARRTTNKTLLILLLTIFTAVSRKAKLNHLSYQWLRQHRLLFPIWHSLGMSPRSNSNSGVLPVREAEWQSVISDVNTSVGFLEIVLGYSQVSSFICIGCLFRIYLNMDLPGWSTSAYDLSSSCTWWEILALKISSFESPYTLLLLVMEQGLIHLLRSVGCCF